VAEFAHLHLHTDYSLLDGMGRISQYVDRAKEFGMKHMAVSDHGVMYAAMDWHQDLVKAGLHPIIGMEAYMAEGSMYARERKNYHLLLLARNEIGHKNLMKLASKASLEGFYYRPRIDLDALQEHHEGIIATSACLGGPVANNFLSGNPEKARDYAGKLAEIFGPEHFYIEIQDHGIEEQIRTNRDLIPLAKELGLPLVATNDVHYCYEGDASAQDVLVCVQTNTTIHDTKRLKQHTDQMYLKSPDEMERLFGDVPESLSNTIRIAEMCDLDLGFKGFQLPEFDVPEGYTSETYLEYLCKKGAHARYGTIDGPVGERLAYELGIINRMGFTNYFLITWDFVDFAKRNGIFVGPGRGSAAGSIVTFSLNITGLDPLEHDLIFERFLNPDRISMPDIDIDFADDRRGEVIDYVVSKYGDDRVAQIVTFGTLKAKASVRDVGRALGLSFAETDRVARLIPTDPKMTIEKAMAQVPELAQLYDADTQVRELIDYARKVEGLARHSSTHAAGVVISRGPLVESVPLQRASGKSEGDITTQWAMGHMETLGLLKMDFLGLRTLTVLRKAIDLVRATGVDLTIDTIPMEDEKAFDLLCRGETFGVFQLEGGMTTRMTIDVAPRKFDDLTALMALIRPGPMELAPQFIAVKHGREEARYPHETLEHILAPTHGVPIYQEQVMQMANVLAGFSMAESDGLRKAMGKKLPEEMAKYRNRFIDGCKDNGHPEKLAVEVFEMIEKFAGYGFPKAHSAAYAVIGAQTAYLKANYPVQFMAAMMSTEIGSSDRIVVDVAECRRAGILVLPPDVNRSVGDFSVERLEDGAEAVRFGLVAVRNVGAGVVDHILAKRQEQADGQFSSVQAFCDAVDWQLVNKRAVESLIKAGAFDGLGERASILASLDATISAVQQRQKAAARGQMDLFGMVAEPIDIGVASGSNGAGVPAADDREKLAWEKEFLGLYMSSHPLTDLFANGTPDGYTQIAQLNDHAEKDTVRLVGMITGMRRIATRTNKMMAVIEVEDLTGTIEAVAFPERYEALGGLLAADAIIEITAKIDTRGDRRQLIIEDASRDLPLARVAETPPVAPIEIRLPVSGDIWRDIAVMQALHALLERHEGDRPVELLVPSGSNIRRFRSRNRRVEWSQTLMRELEDALGPNCVRLEHEAVPQAAD
jgi:DNA polymerase-3 subunit alpha